MPPNPVPIYRIMHVSNLENIVGTGYLFCENKRHRHDAPWKSIAHENIQYRRRAKPVPCGAGGTVCDYVPWYYAPRSPMLYAHFKEKVPGNSEGQNPIIYFRSTIQRVVAANLPFVFTDGHAIMFNSHFFDDLKDLNQIDWPLMLSRFWNATDADPDRPRRRQAEFLIHHRFPLSLVEEIVVFNREALTVAQNCLNNLSQAPIIRVDKSWYF
jgi:hypothetical protein